MKTKREEKVEYGWKGDWQGDLSLLYMIRRPCLNGKGGWISEESLLHQVGKCWDIIRGLGG